MKLSIVIISWNSQPMLRACLHSLRQMVCRPAVELIWVDNGSHDGSAAMVEKEYPQAVRILLPRNRGVAYARNRGVEAATGEYVLFLDDDTEASPEAIDALLTYMDTHPSIGIAGCALRDSEGNLQDSFKPYPALRRKVANVVRAKCGRPTPPVKLPAGVIHPTYIIGACQLIRRSLFEKIGLLDEAIFYGPEDADFCLRARKAGYDIAYLPAVSILHHWRRITSRSLFSPISRRHMAALIHFWLKHRRL